MPFYPPVGLLVVKDAIFNFRQAVITVAIDFIDTDFHIASDSSVGKAGCLS